MQDKHLSTEQVQPVNAEEIAAPEQQEQTSLPINAMLRQALPRLRDLALYAALLGPIIVEQNSLDSLGHGGGW